MNLSEKKLFATGIIINTIMWATAYSNIIAGSDASHSSRTKVNSVQLELTAQVHYRLQNEDLRLCYELIQQFGMHVFELISQ